MNKKDLLQIGVFLIAIIGAVVGFNTYFAKAADLKLVDMRLEQKIVSDASMQTEARKWQLLDRNNVRDCSDIKNEKDKEECRSLEQKIKEFDRRNQILMEKTTIK
jgi:hypothetical protein